MRAFPWVFGVGRRKGRWGSQPASQPAVVESNASWSPSCVYFARVVVVVVVVVRKCVAYVLYVSLDGSPSRCAWVRVRVLS